MNKVTGNLTLTFKIRWEFLKLAFTRSKEVKLTLNSHEITFTNKWRGIETEQILVDELEQGKANDTTTT